MTTLTDTVTTDTPYTSTKWQSRKFWMSVGCILITTGLLWGGKIDQIVYQNILYLLVGGYLTSTTTQNILLAKEKES